MKKEKKLPEYQSTKKYLLQENKHAANVKNICQGLVTKHANRDKE